MASSVVKDDWRMVARRLYLDTNTLIDAVLDTKVADGNLSGRERERYLSQVILANWPTTNLIVSPYVIGEFVQRGRKPPYAKTLEEMRQIVSDSVLNRCQVAFFKGDMR